MKQQCCSFFYLIAFLSLVKCFFALPPPYLDEAAKRAEFVGYKNMDMKKLDKVLQKCFECVSTSKEGSKYGYGSETCTNNTGWNTISEYGIIRTGSAFVTAYNWPFSYNSQSTSGQGANYKSNDFKVWSDYHKESNRLDELLAKCYECIRDRKKAPKSAAFNSFSAPSFSSMGGVDGIPQNSLAHWLSGPVVNTGGKWVSAGQSMYSNGYGYGSTNLKTHNNQFAHTLSCMVGTLGVDAYMQACEYGNSYCQIVYSAWTTTAGAILNQARGSCVPICVPFRASFGPNGETKTTCSTGTLSNKLNPICLVGDLSTTSTNPAAPVQCPDNSICGISAGQSSCVLNCVTTGATPGTSDTCSSADYGLKTERGPLCYVGTFGSNAPLGEVIPSPPLTSDKNYAYLAGCGKDQFCMTVTSSTTVVGSCQSTCANSSTTTCTRIDFANKRGPICYFGIFGNSNRPQACDFGQVCKRDNIILPTGNSISQGSCASASTCYNSPTTYCCNTDLCNAYDTNLNIKKCDENEYASTLSATSASSNLAASAASTVKEASI